VWDCSGRGPSGTDPIILPGHERRVTAVAFQHDGPLLATGGDEGRVVLWQPGAKRVLRGATLLSQPVSHLAWAPDDRDVLIGCAGGDLVLLRRD
jgi:WD40 repeat protein